MIHLPLSTTIETRSSVFYLRKGFYVYVGSAMGSLLGRVKHHEGRRKTPFWHVDYLLERSRLLLSVMVPSERRVEGDLASFLSGEPVRGFGSSDTKDLSHLFFYSRLEEAFYDALRAARRVI